MVRAVRILGRVFLFLGAALIVAGLSGVWLQGGFSAVRDVMSPFNLWQYIAVVVTLLPGMGLLWLADWMERRQR